MRNSLNLYTAGCLPAEACCCLCKLAADAQLLKGCNCLDVLRRCQRSNDHASYGQRLLARLPICVCAEREDGKTFTEGWTCQGHCKVPLKERRGKVPAQDCNLKHVVSLWLACRLRSGTRKDGFATGLLTKCTNNVASAELWLVAPAAQCCTITCASARECRDFTNRRLIAD